MIAIATLLLVVTISLIVTRVATVILTASGLSRQAAQFQARSAFTGSGFTTSESERVVDNPLRRRVIMTLMLLGNAGIVAAASTTILGFRGGGIGHQGWRVLELVAGLVALLYLSRSRWVDQRLTRLIKRAIDRYTDLPTRDLAGLLDLSGEYAVNELAVTERDWIAGRRLQDLALRDEGAVVLGITRKSGVYLGAPTGETVLDAGDILIVYGRGELLRELDDRPVGPGGDLAHAAAVARQRRIEQEQAETAREPDPA
ncbi:MAG TPA: TrkA C-terminal domain-containing protein [Mycobacteriales bacterium]